MTNLFRLSLAFFCIAAVASCTLFAQSQLDDEQERANFNKTVAEALPALVDSCKVAKPLPQPTVRGPRMIWSQSSEAADKKFYRLDWGITSDKQVNIPRDKDKPTTLVLVVEEIKGKKTGFYLNGADAYSIDFETCVIDWPEKRIRGTARMTSSPPQTVRQYSSLYAVHHDQLVDWIYTWPAEDLLKR